MRGLEWPSVLVIEQKLFETPTSRCMLPCSNAGDVKALRFEPRRPRADLAVVISHPARFLSIEAENICLCTRGEDTWYV